MAFTKLFPLMSVICGVILQIAHSNARVYDPTPLTNQATLQQALLNQANINRAAAYNQAAVNQAAYNQAIINQPELLNNPLYDYKNILSYPPYNLFCECDCSMYINDLNVISELNRIADDYNLRICDIHQWYLIIDEVMPDLPDQPQRLSMIESLASSLSNEQARRQLVTATEYPAFCKNIYQQSLPGLVKRSPDDMDYVTYPTSLTAATTSPLAYYYNLMYLMEKTLPKLSPQLQQDIKDSVYLNSDVQQLGQAPELIKRLTSNIRVDISQMYDLTPVYY